MNYDKNERSRLSWDAYKFMHKQLCKIDLKWLDRNWKRIYILPTAFVINRTS